MKIWEVIKMQSKTIYLSDIIIEYESFISQLEFDDFTFVSN